MAAKQQCFFCSDTVSTGTLNRNYYKMHLENVHSIQANKELLLNWILNTQKLSVKGGGGGGSSGGGSTLSSVASIMGMKGITITKDTSSPSSNGMPNSLINIKGITVQKVSNDASPPPGAGGGTPRGRGAPPNMRGGVARGGGMANPRPTMQQANIARQQEQAIERWSNACEHGCRLCRSQGKNFSTFHRNTLLKHLEKEHSIGEREYKEEFKCQNLITRAANLTCAICKHKVKRIPSSLSAHLKRHALTIRQYWMKHVAPKGSALATFNPSPAMRAQLARGGGRGIARGGPVPRGGRGGFAPVFRGTVRPQGVGRPNLHTDLPNQKKSQINGSAYPKVMLNRVDDDTIKREEAGLGNDDAMEVELDPLTLLEMGMGEDVIQLEGVAVKEEVASGDEEEENNDSAPMQLTPDQEMRVKQEVEDTQEENNTDSRDLVTPEVFEDGSSQEDQEEDSSSLNPQDQQDGTSEFGRDKKAEPETGDDDLEVVCDVSVQKRDPSTAIPLPDLFSPSKESADKARLAEEENKKAEAEQKPNKHSIGRILNDDKGGEDGEEQMPSTEAGKTDQTLSPVVATAAITSTQEEATQKSDQVTNSQTSEPSINTTVAESSAAEAPADASTAMSKLEAMVATSTPPVLSPPKPPLQTAAPMETSHFTPPPAPGPVPTSGQSFQPFQPFHPNPAASSPFPPTPYHHTNQYNNGYPPAPPPQHQQYTTFPPQQNNHFMPPNSSPHHPAAAYGGSPQHPQQFHPPPQSAYSGGGGAQPFQPSPAQAVPKTRWDGLSCPYSIAQCPLYCCHVRAMQEVEEGSTDWSRPYGPPANGFGPPCSCCINA